MCVFNKFYVSLQAFLLPRREIPLFGLFLDTWDDAVIVLNEDLHDHIDFVESKLRGSIHIRDGVWEALDLVRSHHASLPDFLTHLALTDLEAGSIPAEVNTFTYQFLPQVGYQLVVPTGHTHEAGPPAAIPGLDFQFRSDENIFYKNFRARELDASIGDIQGTVHDMQTSLARELESM